MVLLKLALVFAAMLAGIRSKKPLWLSILAGGLLAALVFGQGLGGFFRAAAIALTDAKALYLGAIVALILALSGLLESTGQAQRLSKALSGRLTNPRLRLIFFPCLIGLLPMPGGAVFSAPLLDGSARGLAVSKRRLVLINYWFRHVWEFCWPLYPGMILAASLADTQLFHLVALAAPGAMACLVIGWLLFLRPKALPLPADCGPETAETTPWREVFTQAAPLATAIGGAILLEALLAVAPVVAFEWGVIAALAAAVTVTARQNRLPLWAVLQAMASKHLVQMLLVIAAIFVFKETLSRADVPSALAALLGGDAALAVTAAVLPCILGFVGGITIAFVGGAFPLMLGALATLGLTEHTLAYCVLALSWGLAGVMASPLHICFILSCQYFHVELAHAWKKLLAPSAMLAAFGSLYFLLLRSIL